MPAQSLYPTVTDDQATVLIPLEDLLTAGHGSHSEQEIADRLGLPVDVVRKRIEGTGPLADLGVATAQVLRRRRVRAIAVTVLFVLAAVVLWQSMPALPGGGHLPWFGTAATTSPAPSVNVRIAPASLSLIEPKAGTVTRPLADSHSAAVRASVTQHGTSAAGHGSASVSGPGGSASGDVAAGASGGGSSGGGSLVGDVADTVGGVVGSAGGTVAGTVGSATGTAGGLVQSAGATAAGTVDSAGATASGVTGQTAQAAAGAVTSTGQQAAGAVQAATQAAQAALSAVGGLFG